MNLKLITDLFPLWAVLFSLLAYFVPELFAPMRGSIVPLLGVVMFGMGATLAPRDFAEVARRPAHVAVGTLLQFGIMPLAAWGVARALGLGPELAAGLILVGSCPGGTASNVICFLARADVALSISLTAVSTLVAILATPMLTQLYAGTSVDVDVVGMIWSIFKIVLIPVALGMWVNVTFGARLARMQRLFPLLSVLAIVWIIAIIVALSHERIQTLTGLVLAAVVLHNLIGVTAGYGVARLLGFGAAQCRTLAIEVGMQNSGLGVALAIKHFSSLAALPGAIFSVWHNLSGSALAALWSRRHEPS